MVDVLFGSVEAGAASGAGYTDALGAVMDYDGTNYAQITAKASGGGSTGLKLRAIIAGVLTTLLSFAPGSTAAAFAGNLSAQAVTATSLAQSGATVAATGFLRLPNNQSIAWRNASNTSDVGLYVDGSNVMQVSGAMSINAGLTVFAGISSFAGLVNVNPSAAASSALQFYVGATRCGGVGLSSWAFGDGLNDFALWADTGKAIKFGAVVSGGQSGLITSGVFAWGTTSTGTGTVAVAGDTVIANGARHRALSSGGAAFSMLSMDSNNIVQLGDTGNGIPVALAQKPSTAIGASSIAKGITFAASDVAGTLVFFDGVTGARYKLVGTAF